ncbi:copper chaperone NosL [Maribacter caenipelagi]|uniref:Copper chaperone NosL n=1 Tax=Maribacter caenipelagi TaxID=1447781 RepID=A0A4R7CY69_9FLAO|nr:nitrous oxide reductase accessory protein NosL [Maribacter caenipelagi]TDS12832.1 copper chaperone NosL [Maribacter caenipelagi]
MKNYSILFALLCFMLIGCNSSPKAIAYGSDGCHFCSMTIVDKQHAAQFMTKKGRTYSFDATECMLNHLKDIDMATIAQYSVNDYDEPGALIDATKATYLISKNIPSPMGEYLSAFGNLEAANKTKEENGGELFTWDQLQTKFNVAQH